MKNILGIDLDALLRAAVRESVDAALGSDEKQKQKAAVHSLKPFKAKKKSHDNVEKNVDEDEAQEPVSKKQTSEELPEIDLNVIVELVGSIRAGRSLKDKGALKDLKLYFNRLNGNERTALYAFLTGISKIMRTPDSEETPEPKTPDDSPYSVKIDKISKKVRAKSSPSKEEASDDSPIIVGESANKVFVTRTFRRNLND
jgi:hypothetical protein